MAHEVGTGLAEAAVSVVPGAVPSFPSSAASRPRLALVGTQEAAKPRSTLVEETPYLGVRNTEDNLPAHHLLSMVLSFVMPPEQAGSAAKALLDCFGTLGSALAAPPSRLRAVLDNSEQAFILLRTVRLLSRKIMREPIEDRPILSSCRRLADYLNATMRHETKEAVIIFYLDRKNGLIREEAHSVGTIDHVPLYPREVARRALDLEASAIIMVHNHPSGDATPSLADVQMTKLVENALNSLEIKLHDHFIVGKGKAITSMKTQKWI